MRSNPRHGATARHRLPVLLLLAIPTPRNCCWGPRNIHYGDSLQKIFPVIWAQITFRGRNHERKDLLRHTRAAQREEQGGERAHGLPASRNGCSSGAELRNALASSQFALCFGPISPLPPRGTGACNGGRRAQRSVVLAVGARSTAN